MHPLLIALAIAAGQPAPDDRPVATGVKAVPPPKGSRPVSEEKTAPAAVAAARTLAFEPKTKVDGGTLQIVLGQRALFSLDAKGTPVLEKVEQGQLAAAHPSGKVKETFASPPDGQIAVALDGSAEAKATVLKVWNQTGKAIDYRAVALVMGAGKLTPAPAPVCNVAAGSVRTETWRRPVVAVGLARFTQSAAVRACK